MAVAALYDIHGNLPALDAVLADLARLDVSAIVVGGDVMPGPMPAECLARLRALRIATYWVRGNGDRESVAHRAGEGSASLPAGVREQLRWCGAQLSDEEAAFVATWPTTVRLTIAPIGDVVFCHATPRNDLDIFVAQTPEAPLRPLFDDARAPLVVCGHTHMAFDRSIGTTRVVNAGSVGMPFGTPGAHWLLIGQGIEFRLTSYDAHAAAASMRATLYPAREEFIERNVLHTPGAQEMTELLRRGEVR